MKLIIAFHTFASTAKNLRDSPIQCIYVFCLIVKTSSDYLPTQA